MKKFILLALVFVVTVVAGIIGSRLLGSETPWYGRCKFGQSGISLEFIVLGRAVYLDRNVDGKAQSDELLCKVDSLDVPATNESQGYQIGQFWVPFERDEPSPKTPKVLKLVEVRGNDCDYVMDGQIVLSRNRSSADECHFFGPLAIHLFATDNSILPHSEATLTPDSEAGFKIGLATIYESSTNICPVTGPTRAVVLSSSPSDLETYAFDGMVGPDLEIVFETTTSQSRKNFKFDGFC
jgi:hypothetical protein